MHRVCLVMCSSEKAPTAMRAADFYLSRRFQLDRLDAEQNFDSWFVLSAKYGLLPPTRVVETYDVNLNTVSGAERDAWGQRVVKALCEEFPEGDICVEIRAQVSYYDPLRAPLIAFGFKKAAGAPGDGRYRYVRLRYPADASSA
jgi:hypothetical protein